MKNLSPSDVCKASMRVRHFLK
ncbi:hypothetical protein [Priestia koreensis]